LDVRTAGEIVIGLVGPHPDCWFAHWYQHHMVIAGVNRKRAAPQFALDERDEADEIYSG